MLAPLVGLSLSLLHVHILWQQISMHVWLSVPISLSIPHDLPISLVQVYQQVPSQWFNDKWAPSPPELSPCPLCFCSWWNTAQDLLQIVYFILLYQAPFCMARINLLPRQSTGEENKYSWIERWLGERLCEFTECYSYETSVLFCRSVQITRMKWLAHDDGREYSRYFYISQTQDVVPQPPIYLRGFPFLTIISKLKTDQKKCLV